MDFIIPDTRRDQPAGRAAQASAMPAQRSVAVTSLPAKLTSTYSLIADGEGLGEILGLVRRWADSRPARATS